MSFEPLTLKEIQAGIRRPGRPVRILCEGVFDLFHIGHVKVLRQAKQAFPDVYLIAGVNTDEEVLQHKGGRTVMTFRERLEAVKECPYVDEVLEHTPFIYGPEFLAEIQKIDRLLPTQRTEGISSTELIQRILDSPSEFIARNQKRGHHQINGHSSE